MKAGAQPGNTVPADGVPPPAEADANLQKVDHIVVLMMENRSFDHMLGYLSIDAGRSEIDGVPPGFKNNASGTDYPVHQARCTKLVKAQDPCHSGWCVDEQTAGGAMSGFASNYAKTRTESYPGDSAETVLAFHTAKQLPVYDYLADAFGVCDRWFCSVPGATMPNRCYAVAGRAQGSRDNINPPLYHLSSFVRHLDHAGRSWRWYAHDNVPLLWFIDQFYAFGHLSIPTYFDRHDFFGPKSFLQAAAANQLPDVAWIDPNFIDVSFGPEGSNDDHPPSDLRAGQDLVLRAFHALARSPAWPRTLLLITYDEHGGFFDHVPPPAAPDDDATFRRYGPRVPALAISPWMEQGHVSHVLFDHTSIIKTILMRFCQRPDGSVPDMGARVHGANHLGAVLTAGQPRPAPSQEDYQHLIDEMSQFHAEQHAQAMEMIAASAHAQPVELTDFQEEFLAGKMALEQLRQRAPHTPT